MLKERRMGRNNWWLRTGTVMGRRDYTWKERVRRQRILNNWVG